MNYDQEIEKQYHPENFEESEPEYCFGCGEEITGKYTLVSENNCEPELYCKECK